MTARRDPCLPTRSGVRTLPRSTTPGLTGAAPPNPGRLPHSDQETVPGKDGSGRRSFLKVGLLSRARPALAQSRLASDSELDVADGLPSRPDGTDHRQRLTSRPPVKPYGEGPAVSRRNHLPTDLLDVTTEVVADAKPRARTHGVVLSDSRSGEDATTARQSRHQPLGSVHLAGRRERVAACPEAWVRHGLK